MRFVSVWKYVLWQIQLNWVGVSGGLDNKIVSFYILNRDMNSFFIFPDSFSSDQGTMKPT